MAGQTVTREGISGTLRSLLDSSEIAALTAELEALRWTGRKGYSIRSLVGACLVKSLYAIPTWSRTARLIAEHAALQDALGDTPSVYALYRFTTKLRTNRPALQACLDACAASLRAELPDYGIDVAIDASDLPGYANGQRFVSKNGPEREQYSDPDASWGHRSAVSTRKGGGFYGFRLHVAVCARTDLPVAWRVETARSHEASLADDLLQAVRERVKPETVTMDKGYDTQAIHEACHEAGCLPIIPLKQTTAVKRGEHEPPKCEHGVWSFGGSDRKRNASKWRCRPASASRSRSGSRRVVCIRWSPVSRSGGATCTGVVPRWSERSDD